MSKLQSHAVPILFILAAASCLWPSAANALTYEVGFKWDRYSDFNATGNPVFVKDKKGATVWSYEWFQGQNYSSTTSMKTRWDPNPNVVGGDERWKPQGIYDNDTNISRWDLNNEYYNGYNPNSNSGLIRWTNPAGDNVAIDFAGSLKLYWGGQANNYQGSFSSTPVDVRLIMGIVDATTNQTTLIKDQRITSPFSDNLYDITNFGNCPNITIPIDFLIKMDAGDSFFWSAIPLGQTTIGNRWLTLNDNQMDITMAPVPEPASIILFGSGLAGLLAGVARRRSKG